MSKPGVSAAGFTVWVSVLALVLFPIVMAAINPLQASREALHVIGSMSAVVALSLLLLQPLMAAGLLPGINVLKARRWHQVSGYALMLCVVLHIVGLYLVSPDDMSDALLLVAPTPFSLYGGIALWALVLTSILMMAQHRMRRYRVLWLWLHNLLALAIVIGSVVHAWMIIGVMHTPSKMLLCVAVVTVTLASLGYMRVVKPYFNRSK